MAKDVVGHEGTELPFDPDALRRKYREERDKRLREDGHQQYREVTGEFSQYLEDPYVEPGFTREPLTDEVDVVIIGGGFGGLLAGARLREAGVRDVRIIEKGGDFGGTWYWNRYPGAQCDVESYIYLPLCEELGYIPSEKYAHAPEILAHSHTIGERFGLYDKACFQTQVTELRWDDDGSRWIVSTDRDDRLRARFVCMATGPLNRPKLPGIAGIESFRGHSFHTSRWDYEYTGGTCEGDLVGLRDKRVGIIGTGATAVQCIPYLGEAAEHLYVFQRTPSSIDVRANRPTDPAWAASLEPGRQKRRMENFNNLVSGVFEPEDLVGDGWTDIIARLAVMAEKDGNADLPPKARIAMMEMADFEKMEQIRARVDAVVQDPAVAEALKPWYRQLCKRPCFHDDYLDTFNRPNVTLVDTHGRGVERITERGPVVDGVEYEVDCLIYATGFEVGTDYARRAGYQIIGRGGITLTEKWANGVTTLHGMHSRGFPNCFILSTVQSGLTVNFPHAMDEQSKHLTYIISHALENDIQVVEASEQGEADWVKRIEELAVHYLRFFESCTPSYYNNEGETGNPRTQNFFAGYGGGANEFFRLMADWRAAGEFAGLELSS